MQSPLTIGAQEGGLARAQAEHVVALLKRHRLPYPVHLELIDVDGSEESSCHDDHIAENRTRIRALHDLLRHGEVDVVIHRGFDLRGQIPDDLNVAAVLTRSSPFDALISPWEMTLEELEEGSRVGVVQLRARAQLLEHRPDLDLELIVGDVGTWLTALIDGQVEALVAPNAALEQLGLQARVCEIFPPEMLLPAPGSGVLVCVTRAEDRQNTERLRRLHHAPTEAEYAAEVSFLETLDGAWEYPIGVLAQCIGDDMAIMGLVASVDGFHMLRDGIRGPAEDPLALGQALAERMLSSGAHGVLHAGVGDEGQGSARGSALLPADEAEWMNEDLDEAD